MGPVLVGIMKHWEHLPEESNVGTSRTRILWWRYNTLMGRVCLFFYLRQDLTLCVGWPWTHLCNPGWPWTYCDPPASAGVVGLDIHYHAWQRVCFLTIDSILLGRLLHVWCQNSLYHNKKSRPPHSLITDTKTWSPTWTKINLAKMEVNLKNQSFLGLGQKTCL